MEAPGASIHGPVHGLVDRDGRLVQADAALDALHARAGGAAGGVIAVPQLASVARLARRLGIVVSRGVIAADGEADLDLWVRARPEGDHVRLAIVQWTERPAALPYPARRAERDRDFARAGAEAVWETDEALNLTTVPSASALAIGVQPSALIGAPLTRLVTLVEDADGAMPLLAALAGHGRFDRQRARLRSPDGGRAVLLSGVPLIDGAGSFAGFRGTIASDEGALTDRPPQPPAEAFSDQLGRALRAPLDRIVAQADSIGALSEGPLRSEYHDYAGDIASAGRHLLSLIDDLVDLQAIERADFAPEIETIDLADVTRRAAGLLSVRAADRDVRIDRPPADETLPALGDFRRVLQILVNLIGNAVRHSPPGGMVWIRMEREEGTVSVIVADQGQGIAIEDQDRIFEKFVRVDPAAPGGTGLGLYIARRLARAMGGDIAVDSAPGQGARFLLTLKAG